MKRVTKLTKLPFFFLIIFIFIGILVYFILMHFFYDSKVDNVFQNFTYEFGPYSYNTKYYGTSPSFGFWTSSIFSYSDCSVGVGGVMSGNINSTEFIYWNTRGLKYSSNQIKNESLQRLRNLQTLDQYTDTSKLLKTTLSENYLEDFGALSVSDVWSGLADCGHYRDVPILIQKVDSSKYDFVYYFEALSRGVRFRFSPQRGLVFKKGNDWLMVRGFNPIGSANGCNDWPKCAEENWSKNYRIGEDNMKWVNGILTSITLKGV